MSAALPPATARKAQLGVNASFPMDGQDEFSLGIIHIDEDFLNKSPGDALLELGTCGRIGPDRLELTGELVQVFPRFDLYRINCSAVLLNAHFDLVHVL